MKGWNEKIKCIMMYNKICILLFRVYTFFRSFEIKLRLNCLLPELYSILLLLHKLMEIFFNSKFFISFPAFNMWNCWCHFSKWNKLMYGYDDVKWLKNEYFIKQSLTTEWIPCENAYSMYIVSLYAKGFNKRILLFRFLQATK